MEDAKKERKKFSELTREDAVRLLGNLHLRILRGDAPKATIAEQLESARWLIDNAPQSVDACPPEPQRMQFSVRAVFAFAGKHYETNPYPTDQAALAAVPPGAITLGYRYEES